MSDNQPKAIGENELRAILYGLNDIGDDDLTFQSPPVIRSIVTELLERTAARYRKPKG